MMGEPCVKFGDCTVYIQHIQSKMWLGYLVRMFVMLWINLCSSLTFDALVITVCLHTYVSFPVN